MNDKNELFIKKVSKISQLNDKKITIKFLPINQKV